MKSSATAILLFFALSSGAWGRACPLPSTAGSQAQLDYAACLTRQGNWKEASRQIIAYRAVHPDSVEAVMIQGQILLGSRRFLDASSLLESAMAAHPRSVRLLTLYAELLRQLGQQDEAENTLQQCARLAPKDAATWKRLGDFHLAQKPQKAIADFQRATALAPDDPLALAGLAEARAESGQNAAKDFERAAALNAKAHKPDAMVNLLYANYLDERKKYDASIVQYNLTVREDPTIADAYLGRGRAYAALEKWTEAERDLEKSANDPRDCLQSLVALVRVYSKDNKKNQAQRYAAEVAKLSATQSASRAKGNNIARQLDSAGALMRQHKFTQAAGLYKALLKQHPEVDEARLQLAQCEMQTGKAPEAEALLREYLSRNDASATAHTLLGRALLEQNQIQAAVKEFRRASFIDPLYMNARLGLAASSILEKDYPKAIAILEAAQAIGTKDNDVWLMEAEALYKNHNRDAAVQKLKQVLQADPENPSATMMLKEVNQRPARK